MSADADPWEAAPAPAGDKDPWEAAAESPGKKEPWETATAAEKHHEQTSFVGEVGRGIMDPVYGGMQTAAHVADQPLARSALSLIPGGGALAFLPAAVTRAAKEYADKTVREREEKIAAERGEDAGKMDWGRTAGNVLSPVTLASGIGAGIEGAAARGFTGLVKSLGLGGMTGALAGATEPVADTKNYETAKAAQVGAGGVLGGALGLAGKGVSEGAKMAGEYVLRTHPEAAENAAVQMILKRWGQDSKYGGGTATEALDLINATNKPMALADVAPSNVRALGGSVARTPGESQQVAKQFLNERNTEAANRLSADIDTYVHSGESAYKTVQTLLRSRSAAAAMPYDAMRELKIWSPRLDEFFANPRIQEGLNRGVEMERDLALAEGRSMSTTQLGIELDMEGNVKLVEKPSMALLDMAKRGLDAIISESRDEFGRVNAKGFAAGKLKEAFLGEIDSLDKNGAYKKARSVWGGYSASKDAVILGGKLMSENRSLAENEELIASLSDGDKQFLRLGLADNLRARLDKITDITGDLKTVTPLLTSAEITKRIRPAFRSKEEADAFVKAVADEHAMASSRKGYLGGSQSIERGMEEATNALESVGKAKDFLTSGLFKKAAMAWDLYSKIGQAPPAKIREEIAKILFTSDIQPASRVGQKLQGKLPTAQPNPNQGVADTATGVGVGLAAPAAQGAAPRQDIPRLAEGGVVTKPTLAVIGEAGPEAVVPLSQGDPFEVAAMRQRQAVQPPGGRQEGVGTDLATKFIPALAQSALHGFMAGPELMGDVAAGRVDPSSEEGIHRATDVAMANVGRPMPGRGAMLGSGAVTRAAERPSGILALKDAIEASPPAQGMVRLYRGGGNNLGGPKWVTTNRKYAEGYTTPGLAYTDKAGSYLQYVDVPETDVRAQMPAGQTTHSFEAPEDIASQLKPLYQRGGRP